MDLLSGAKARRHWCGNTLTTSHRFAERKGARVLNFKERVFASGKPLPSNQSLELRRLKSHQRQLVVTNNASGDECRSLPIAECQLPNSIRDAA